MACSTTEAGGLQIDYETLWGADGEDLAATSDSLLNQNTGALTEDQRLDIDISAAFTGVAAGDLIGLRANQDTSSKIAYWFGARVKYVSGA